MSQVRVLKQRRSSLPNGSEQTGFRRLWLRLCALRYFRRCERWTAHKHSKLGNENVACGQICFCIIAHARTHARTHTHAHTRTHARTHARARAHTYTHTRRDFDAKNIFTVLISPLRNKGACVVSGRGQIARSMRFERRVLRGEKK